MSQQEVPSRQVGPYDRHCTSTCSRSDNYLIFFLDTAFWQQGKLEDAPCVFMDKLPTCLLCFGEFEGGREGQQGWSTTGTEDFDIF